MRQLNTGDVFKMLQILRAAGVKDEFAEAMNSTLTKKSAEEIGGKAFAMFFNCLGHEKAEVLITKLLADIAEVKPDKITQQTIPETIALLKEIAAQNDLKSFFGNAASLMK